MVSAQVFTNADLFNGNLIVNGNAETANKPSDVSTITVIPVPGWTKEGFLTIAKYMPANYTGDLVSQVSGGPTSRGLNLFMVASTGFNDIVGVASQIVDVSPARQFVDTGDVFYDMSGYFGGLTSRTGTGELSVQFIDQNGQVLNASAIGNVSAAERGNNTSLLKRQASGKVPIRTRSIKLVLTLTEIYQFGGPGGVSGPREAYADNLSFRLLSPAILPQSLTVSPAVEIVMATEQGKTYQLQYVPDLETQAGWIDMGVPFEGDGTVYRIFDSCTPGKARRLYRMVIVP